MTAEEFLRESNIVRNLRQTSEARGMQFYLNPPREVVPEFLGDFRPDAIARGPEGGIVIEMTFPGRSDAKRSLAEISKLVSSQKGWEFHAIYVNPKIDEPPLIAKPTAPQLQSAFAEIEALMKGQHYRTALMAAWAALQSLARLTSHQAEDEPPRAFASREAIQMLAEDGYLENEAADRLRRMTRQGYAVVHGDLGVGVSNDDVEWLLGTLRAIAAEMDAVHA